MSGGERAPAPAYVELHCHSHYSFLDGASRPGELLDQARELGYDVLALTDHDGLYGAMEFARAAQDRRMRAITGAEITVAVADGDEHRRHHLLLLCEDRQGYANLCRLLSHAHLTHEKGAPAVDPETLSRHSRGLIALSGCPQGEVPWLIAAGRQAEAAAAAGRYREMFGPQHFFLELQRNLVYGDAARNRGLQAIARRLGLGVVATNDVHYHVRARSRLQDALVAIRHRTTLDESHALRRPNSEFYLKSPQEMAQLFADCPQALATTRRIAERCRFDLAVHLDYRFPDYPCPEGETPDTFLRRLCLAALRRLYQGTERQQAQRRLDRELGLVKKHGLAGFFLIYHELMELAKEVAREVYGDTHPGRPPGRGRGSSVGSLICYLIGLSHIDPLKNRLFVGRFLNDELASVPDVDLDFSREVREKLILRVYERYGHERVGLVCSFPTYRLRLAVRDLGKVLRLPAAMLDRLARLAEHRAADGLEEEMARYAEFRPLLEAPLWRELVALSKEIAGFPRHISQHVGGMVIASQPLVELVPLEPARMPGRVICQWDKDSIDDARMVKVDFLALGMLSLVDYCLAEIAAQDGEVVDLSRIDFNDQQVYDTICAGDTIGIFQVESRAQAQTLPRTRPRSLQDLTVQVAIVRPGPILGRAVNPYILRRQGKEAVIYDHVLLKPLLKETLGVILYQEQVIQVPMRLAGFSAGRADQFRRAMSRKRSEDAMGAFEDEFLQGARVHGVDETTGKRIFAKLMGFAEYGFPKSHAAAFALLAYQSAWLRTYHPVEFTCALFNAQPMGFYPPEVLVGDARRHNIQILRPEINRSRWRCTVERVPPRCARSSEFQVPGSELAVASELGTPNSGLGTRHGDPRRALPLLRV
ncbi:MAG TPA: DNA polymerase III subunit alpha, partial [Chloroflexota bacterium]|nr:DNA polymerase III subunit alpha [Chloroflexota bacterium]